MSTPANGTRASYANLHMLDLRFNYDVPVERLEHSLALDIFNLTNANTITRVNALSGASFDRVIEFVPPRVLRFGVKVRLLTHMRHAGASDHRAGAHRVHAGGRTRSRGPRPRGCRHGAARPGAVVVEGRGHRRRVGGEPEWRSRHREYHGGHRRRPHHGGRSGGFHHRAARRGGDSRRRQVDRRPA